MVCSNKDASIYYTTDGKEPQPGVSPRYQSPVLADGDRIIKAIAVDGKKKSTTATRTFTGSKAHWSTLPDKAGMLVFDENQHTTWVGKDVLEVDLQSAKEMTGISLSLIHNSAYSLSRILPLLGGCILSKGMYIG